MGGDDFEVEEPKSSEMMKFVLEKSHNPQTLFRVGQLAKNGQNSIATPSYVVQTSRGVVPHLSHDNLHRHTRIRAAYFGLEDFIEKPIFEAPIFHIPLKDGNSRLRQYTKLPASIVSILGPRRVPGIICPASNTNSSISICTSVGFRTLYAGDYINDSRLLGSDICTSLVDVPSGDQISKKRIEKSADRSLAWLRDTMTDTNWKQSTESSLFASVPPLEPENQAIYLSDLANDYKPDLSGLCLYSAQIVDSLPKTLKELPRICLSNPATPQDILKSVSLGIDLITIPFITTSSEYGITLSFDFPSHKASGTAPLGIDLWSTEHATDLSTLTPNCSCYTCSRHHRAYVHHLLQVKEMLAWTLLQIHNFFVIDNFFTQIRNSITKGTFEEDSEKFNLAYEPELPKQTGAGPRVRGYQMKSVGGGEPKKNPKAYGKLDDQLQKLAESESGIATPEGDAMDIEQHGLAKKEE